MYVILSQAVFEYLHLDDLMIIHALKFRTEWNNFLEFMTDTYNKREFILKYKKLLTYAKDSSRTIDYMAKGLEGVYKGEMDMSNFEEQTNFKDINRGAFTDYYNLAKEILQLYPNIEKQYPQFLLLRNPLCNFLSTTYHDEQIMNRLELMQDLEVFRRASKATSVEPT